VLVPDRPGFKTWLQDRRGEWEARTGAKLILVEPKADQPEPSVDVVIYPSIGMAKVVDGGKVEPLPKEIVDGPAYKWHDVALAVRERLCEWARRPCAVPLLAGCTVLYYRTDLFADEQVRAEFKKRYGTELAPPQTWEQLDRLIRFFATRNGQSGGGLSGKAIAVAGWAEAFLARAAAYGNHPEYLSFLFHIDTLEPLVTGPPFQRAFNEWSAVADAVAVSPDLAPFRSGQVPLALASSLHAPLLLLDPHSKVAATLGCCPAPGSAKVYDHVKRQWTELPAESINRGTLIEGWLASVTNYSLHKRAAMDLLAYLTGPENSLISVAAPEFNLAPYRQSHLADATAWVAAGWPDSVKPLLGTLSRSLSQSNAAALPRIEIGQQLLDSLDHTLSRTIAASSGKANEALQALRDEWLKLIESAGRQRLIRQYRRSKGMPVIE